MDDHGAHQYHRDAVQGDLEEVSTISDDEPSDVDTIEEVRFGVRDSRDVEAHRPELRSEKSARSVKDSNLVCLLRCQEVRADLNRVGDMGRPRGSRKPQELGIQKEMGRDAYRVGIHIYIPCFVLDGRACVEQDRARPRHWIRY